MLKLSLFSWAACKYLSSIIFCSGFFGLKILTSCIIEIKLNMAFLHFSIVARNSSTLFKISGSPFFATIPSATTIASSASALASELFSCLISSRSFSFSSSQNFVAMSLSSLKRCNKLLRLCVCLVTSPTAARIAVSSSILFCRFESFELFESFEFVLVLF